MDSRLIVQVIINIVNNAIEYTPKGFNICISVKKKDGKVYVSIADDGNGISDEAKSRVFDMFYSGENAIADSRRNCGIGLSLCRSIINAHGVVEDDKSVNSLITTILKTHDYRYLTASNGAAAVIEASSHNPEIVLLDLGLPDTDGVEVIKKSARGPICRSS